MLRLESEPRTSSATHVGCHCLLLQYLVTGSEVSYHVMRRRLPVHLVLGHWQHAPHVLERFARHIAVHLFQCALDLVLELRDGAAQEQDLDAPCQSSSS